MCVVVGGWWWCGGGGGGAGPWHHRRAAREADSPLRAPGGVVLAVKCAALSDRAGTASCCGGRRRRTSKASVRTARRRSLVRAGAARGRHARCSSHRSQSTTGAPEKNLKLPEGKAYGLSKVGKLAAKTLPPPKKPRKRKIYHKCAAGSKIMRVAWWRLVLGHRAAAPAAACP